MSLCQSAGILLCGFSLCSCRCEAIPVRRYPRPDVALRGKSDVANLLDIIRSRATLLRQERGYTFRTAGQMSISQSFLNLIGKIQPTTLEASAAKQHLDVIKTRLETVVSMSSCRVTGSFNRNIPVRGLST
jgi:hypothetical protein